MDIVITPNAIKTEVYLGHDLLRGNLFFDLCGQNKPLIISDATVSALYGPNLETICVPIGEMAKTRAVKEWVEDQMLKKGYGRDTVVIGLGGGAIMDLAGIVASTYLRGVSLILIPTTLLAIVDASIGGKNGVDTPLGKNLIGTIYHPQAIIADLEVLKSLPEREFQNGLSEIYKMGLIADHSIFNVDFETQVLKAIQAKIGIIQQDPTEKGLRRILNFGHTIAHGLETCSHYTLPHGEAVAMGCVVESYLSYRLGYLSEDDYERIQTYFQSPLKLPNSYDRQHLLKALQFDKKGAFRFVLIDQIGHALPFDGAYCRTVEEMALADALTMMEQLYG